MTQPTLTIVVPTIGRATLKDTLDSIARQDLLPGDRVVVALDTFEEPYRPDVAALVAGYGPQFKLLLFDGGYHFFGNPQLNAAIATCQTDFLIALGDDDIYVDGAIARLRKKLQPGRVVLFRFFITGFLSGLFGLRFLLWSDKEVRLANLSGCCMAAPVSSLLPVSADLRPEVDYEWIRDTIAKTGRPPIWMKDCLVIARPDVREGAVVHRGVSDCRGCGWVGYLEDLDEGLCESCAPTVIRELLETA